MELLLLGVGACLHCCVRKHRHTLQTQWPIVSTRCRNAHGRLDNPGLSHNNTRAVRGGNDITAVAEIQMISHLTLHWAPGYSKSWLGPRCWKYFSAVFSSRSPPLMGRRIHLLTIKSRRLFCWVSIGQYQCVCKVKCVWEAESKRASGRRQREMKREKTEMIKAPGLTGDSSSLSRAPACLPNKEPANSIKGQISLRMKGDVKLSLPVKPVTSFHSNYYLWSPGTFS